MTVQLLMYIHLPWMAKGDHCNIQCKTWSAKCDCQSGFISVSEDFKLLQILLIYAGRSRNILSTEYQWYHSKKQPFHHTFPQELNSFSHMELLFLLLILNFGVQIGSLELMYTHILSQNICIIYIHFQAILHVLKIAITINSLKWKLAFSEY